MVSHGPEALMPQPAPRRTTWDPVQLARHPQRPYALDYVHPAFTDFVELHGDRRFGDDPALVAEERGQACSIAENLLAMIHLRVPLVSVVIGEGGSGGALALGDGLLMLENAIHSVAWPEAAASILWKDGARGAEAAEAMKMTAQGPAGLRDPRRHRPRAAGRAAHRPARGG